jgi:hypothetical protein
VREKKKKILPPNSGRYTFAPPLLGFSHIWTVVSEVALLSTCEASSLSFLFPVNVKEKILDLKGHTH